MTVIYTFDGKRGVSKKKKRKKKGFPRWEQFLIVVTRGRILSTFLFVFLANRLLLPLKRLTNVGHISAFKGKKKGGEGIVWERWNLGEGWCPRIIPQNCRNTEAFTRSKPSEFTQAPKSHVACQAVFIERPPGSRVLILWGQKTPQQYNIYIVCGRGEKVGIWLCKCGGGRVYKSGSEFWNLDKILFVASLRTSSVSKRPSADCLFSGNK